MAQFEAPLSCCSAGVPFCCVNFECCANCALGTVWENYGMPGGCIVGTICGGGPCCSFLLRKKIAETHNIEDGAMAFVCPFCCAACNFVQIIMTARREGKFAGMFGVGAPPGAATTPAPAAQTME